MSRKPLVCIALAAGIILAGVSAPIALAESGGERVAYGDLNLSETSDVDRLVHRLNKAAESVCPRNPTGGHYISAKTQTCRREMVRKAVADIGSAELTARLNSILVYPLASR